MVLKQECHQQEQIKPLHFLQIMKHQFNQNQNQKTNKSEKIIFLNNEIVDQNLSEIEEANNDLSNFGNSDENIIELKDEVFENNDQKIIDLIEEVDDIINLTDEVAETVVSKKK